LKKRNIQYLCISNETFADIVVTAGESSIVDRHVLGVPKVDPISVGAVARGRNAHVAHENADAVVEREVEVWAVLDLDAAERDIKTVIESHCLINQSHEKEEEIHINLLHDHTIWKKLRRL